MFSFFLYLNIFKINYNLSNTLHYCIAYLIDSDFIYNKQFILNRLNNSIFHYDDYISKYIKSNGDNLSNKTIIKKIKENFFY